MSRVHFTSKSGNIPSKRVDPRKHDDRPVLDVMVYFDQGRHGVELKVESLFGDRICSWVRIVNGVNKYVTGTSEEIPVASVEVRSTGQLVAKARTRRTPNLTLTPVSVPCRELKRRN